MKKILLACLAALALIGCATDPRIVAFEAGKRKVELDPRVMHECPPLPKLSDSHDVSLKDFLQKVFGEYKECKVWNSEKNRILKDAFNIGEPKKDSK